MPSTTLETPYFQSYSCPEAPSGISFNIQHRFIDRGWSIQLNHWRDLFERGQITTTRIKEIGLAIFNDFQFVVVPWIKQLTSDERQLAVKYYKSPYKFPKIRKFPEKQRVFLCKIYWLEQCEPVVNQEIRKYVMASFLSMLIQLEKTKRPNATVRMTTKIQSLLDDLPNIKTRVHELLEKYYSVLCDVERTYIALGTPVYSVPEPVLDSQNKPSE